jgi:transposase, IS30 family
MCHKLEADPRLRLIVTGLLKRGWSPEAPAHRSPIDYPDDQAVRVPHEAVYSWIYALPVGVMAAEGIALRSSRTRRKPARRRVPCAPRITGMRFIDDRPAEAEDRAVPAAGRVT